MKMAKRMINEELSKAILLIAQNENFYIYDRESDIQEYNTAVFLEELGLLDSSHQDYVFKLTWEGSQALKAKSINYYLQQRDKKYHPKENKLLWRFIIPLLTGILGSIITILIQKLISK